MNPDLVCKIVVRTTSGKRYRGSGYPITPERIITAAHVVADAACKEDAALKGAARAITLAFGVEEQTLTTPVYLEWCGTDAGVDVAVLRCQLPAALQPTHELLNTPPKTPITGEARGYTEFGKAKRQGGQDKYNGTLLTFSAKESTVPLGCDQGLITSAQWEYACRAGIQTARYEARIDAIAWYSANSNNETHAVGQKRPNAWGLYDMLGNVLEWCHDGLRTYDHQEVMDPTGPLDAGADRVVRGGGWSSPAPGVRAVGRVWGPPASAAASLASAVRVQA